jgi:hypothetical protein
VSTGRSARERVAHGAVHAADAELARGDELGGDAGRVPALGPRVRLLRAAGVGEHFERPGAAERVGRRVLRRELFRDVDAEPGHGVVATQLFGRLGRDAVDPVQHLAAVAPARAVPQHPGFEQRDAEIGARAAQMQRSRDAREAAAHDRDVGR